MKLFGSISELLSLVFRKSSFTVTVEPSSASANTIFQLPAANGATQTIATNSSSTTFTGKSVDADVNTITNIDDNDIKTGAGILRSKLASGTANHVLINDGSGVMSSEATLSATRGGLGIVSTATFPASGVVVTRDATETLTNKTLTSPIITTPTTSTAAFKAGQGTNNSITNNTTLTFTEAFDVTGNFASNTFTAPATGKYLFTVAANISSIGTSTLLDVPRIAIRNSTQAVDFATFPWAVVAVNSQIGGSVIESLTAGDAVIVRFLVNNAKNISIDSSVGWTYFTAARLQ